MHKEYIKDSINLSIFCCNWYFKEKLTYDYTTWDDRIKRLLIFTVFWGGRVGRKGRLGLFIRNIIIILVSTSPQWFKIANFRTFGYNIQMNSDIKVQVFANDIYCKCHTSAKNYFTLTFKLRPKIAKIFFCKICISQISRKWLNIEKFFLIKKLLKGTKEKVSLRIFLIYSMMYKILANDYFCKIRFLKISRKQI